MSLHKKVLLMFAGWVILPAFVYAQTTDSQTVGTLQTKIASLLQQINVLQMQLKGGGQIAAVQNSITLGRTLSSGSEGDDVKKLQEWLGRFPDIYPEAKVTGYFGKMTEKAVKKYQKKFGLDQVGIVGPKTREHIRLFSERTTISGSTSTTTESTTTTGTISGSGSVTTASAVSSKQDNATSTSKDTEAAASGTSCRGGSKKCDTTAPLMSNIVATPTTTSAAVSWVTNEAADSVVRYATTSVTASALQVANASYVTSHSLTLTGLSAGMGYRYVVVSKDTSGNTATSSERMFTTTVAATSTATSTTHFWSIRSVSSMKETKDKVCNQDSGSFIGSWVSRAAELGVNYIAVETPYDDPACASSLNYTKAWSDAVHAQGLNVWHRHMPLAFEGIYDTPKSASKDYLQQIHDYIVNNPTLFRENDIFTPIPEPQNGGVSGVTYCAQGICVFNSAASFNKWLRDAITTSNAAFAEIGLGGKIKVGYYGFDGFIAWGDNNPDWNGILEDATIAAMGNITIDHYPEAVGDTMANDLDELQQRYPNVPIVIGEWGTINGGDVVTAINTTMQAARRTGVIGFNYWHMGLGGNEALVNDDLSKKVGFDPVKFFFSE